MKIKQYFNKTISHLIIYSLLLNTVGCATIVPFEPKNVPSKEEIDRIPNLSEKYFFGEDIFIGFDYDLKEQKIKEIIEIFSYNKKIYNNQHNSAYYKMINTKFNKATSPITQFYKNSQNIKTSHTKDSITFNSNMSIEYYLQGEEFYSLNIAKKDSISVGGVGTIASCIVVSPLVFTFGVVLPIVLYPIFLIGDIPKEKINNGIKDNIKSIPEICNIKRGFTSTKIDQNKLDTLRKMLIAELHKELKKLAYTQHDIKTYKSYARTPNLDLGWQYYKRYLNNDIKKAINSAKTISQLQKLEKILEQLNLSKTYSRSIQYKKDSLVGKQKKQSFEELRKQLDEL